MRVSEETRRRASELAVRTGRRMQAVVDEALVAYERALFWESFDDGYRRLAEDPEAWESVVAERSGEAPALADRTE
ncbi:MAG: hypothetical protein H0V92_05305 [Pseudonocardiales bacterium]|nr:hypothetical protein [Pseudonocardiales bacterium]